MSDLFHADNEKSVPAEKGWESQCYLRGQDFLLANRVVNEPVDGLPLTRCAIRCHQRNQR